MKISISELKELTIKAIAGYGYNKEDTRAINEILLHTQLRGNNQGAKLIGKGIPRDPSQFIRTGSRYQHFALGIPAQSDSIVLDMPGGSSQGSHPLLRPGLQGFCPDHGRRDTGRTSGGGVVLRPGRQQGELGTADFTIDTNLLGGRDEFTANVAQIIAKVKSTKQLPGGRNHRARRKRFQEGQGMPGKRGDKNRGQPARRIAQSGRGVIAG